MLAAFAALALSLPADTPTFTVEFRVMRLPADCGAKVFRADPSGQRDTPIDFARREQVLTGASSQHGISGDSLQDAGGLPGDDVGTVPLWLRTAELTGPKLRVGRALGTETMTRPEWTAHTENQQPSWHRGSWQHIRFDTREVLTESVTFTASAVPTDGGRIEVCVRYSETELPAAKKPASPLAPFYANTPAPRSPIPPFRSSPGVVKGTELALLRPGESLMFSAGRRTIRPVTTPFGSRFEDVSRRYETVEEDVIVIATVRE